MKKLTCTLLVTMLTMTAMVLAQTTGFPSTYFTITNKTTQESKMIPANEFTSEGNNQFSYDVDFCLGVYKNDEIEITYTSVFSTNLRVAWAYFWNNDASYSLGTALTANLPVTNIPYDKSELTVTCTRLISIGQNETAHSYNIHFKNVHSNTRFYSDYETYSKLLRITYRYYSEVRSCLTQNPYVVVNKVYPIAIPAVFSGYMNNNGVIIFNTNGERGTYSIQVTVNNVTLPPESTYLY